MQQRDDTVEGNGSVRDIQIETICCALEACADLV
jgi:hypothetical protein